MAWVVRFSSFTIYPLLTGLLFLSPYEPGTRLPLLFAIGLALWSLPEYLLHCFFFHWTPANPRMRHIIPQLHLNHHRDPRHPGKILGHPLYSLPISALLGCGFYLATESLLSTTGLLAGLWAGFLYYEWVHYRPVGCDSGNV